MDTATHNLNTLFQQLGLPDNDAAIDDFVTQHHLSQGEALQNASFWTPAQADFLRDAIDEDADWADAVDTLGALLQRSATVSNQPWISASASRYLPDVVAY